MFRRIFLFLGLSAAAIAGAQAATRPILYVANSQGDDVTVIDLPTQKVMTTIKVGSIVHGVCAPADGRHAYVTIESEHTLKVVDTKTNTVTGTIQLPGQPNECAATSDGHYVVVPLLAPQNSAVVVDTTQNQIVKTFRACANSHNCFTPEGGSNTIVYCEARDNFFIRRIDLSKMEITNDVKVAGDPRPFIVTPDEKTLYTALSGLHGLAIVDIPHQTMSQVMLPPMPWMNCKVEPPNTPVHGIALTADGKKIWITSVADSGVYVYGHRHEEAWVPSSRSAHVPHWISMSKDGKYAGVSNADTDDASIMDAHSGKELARVKVGKAPKRVLVIEVPQDQLTEK